MTTNPNRKSIVRAAGLVSILLFSSIALGDAFPGANTTDGRKAATDGKQLTVCWNVAGVGVPAELTSHLGYMTGTVATRTGIVTAMGGCSAGITDVLYDNAYPLTAYGETICLKVGGDFALSGNVNDVECETWQVTLSIANIDAAADAAGISRSGMRRKVWCHETGHAMGLWHENNCMQQGQLTANTYSDHHLDVHLVGL